MDNSRRTRTALALSSLLVAQLFGSPLLADTEKSAKATKPKVVKAQVLALQTHQKKTVVLLDKGRGQGLKVGDSMVVRRQSKSVATLRLILCFEHIASAEIVRADGAIQVQDRVESLPSVSAIESGRLTFVGPKGVLIVSLGSQHGLEKGDALTVTKGGYAVAVLRVQEVLARACQAKAVSFAKDDGVLLRGMRVEMGQGRRPVKAMESSEAQALLEEALKLKQEAQELERKAKALRARAKGLEAEAKELEGKGQRGLLIGVTVVSVLSEGKMVLRVSKVVKRSRADKAGLKRGDVIESADGQALKKPEDVLILIKLLARPGKTVLVTRRKQERRVAVFPKLKRP